MSESNDLFASIGTPPAAASDAEQTSANAQYVERVADEKASRVNDALDKNQESISQELVLAGKRTEALSGNHLGFDLQQIVTGWFPDKVSDFRALVSQRAALRLTIDSASTFGTISDAVVRQFINSAETKATGEAKLAVAKVLDQATGVAGSIAKDGDVKAQKIEADAKRLLEHVHNAQVLAALFGQLFTKVLNRVVSYQTRLEGIGGDLAEKSVLLDRVAASLRARQEMVKTSLYDTCAFGLALEGIITREQANLAKLEADRDHADASARGPLAEKVKEQQAFVQILIKRLVDLKSFAVKEVGLYSVIGTIRNSVAVVRADVEFTRTNMLATLGLQLGLVVDIVSTLRIAKATQNVREAEAQAAESVGMATDALQTASNDALLNVQTAMRSLEVTIGAAIRGIKNTRENMDKVQTMQHETEGRLGQLFADLGAA